jgi:hypothetical protein
MRRPVNSRGWSAAEPPDARDHPAQPRSGDTGVSRQIALVEHDSAGGQNAPIFVEECFAAVMVHLPLDVFDQAILFAKGHREGAVTILPAFKTREVGVAFQPMAAPGLDFLNVLGIC